MAITTRSHRLPIAPRWTLAPAVAGVRRLASRLSGMLARSRRRERQLSELAAMGEHELRDLGVSREALLRSIRLSSAGTPRGERRDDRSAGAGRDAR